ncbi:MAG: methyltransferase domain-containing protein [Desulfosarcina sp.]|nr:methyltransferase domain-containing protein [Desulfobacterales bacterium]
MLSERLQWNRKYRRETFAAHPSPIVETYARLAPVGRALDVACGNGRNACYLAGLGFAVDAVDIAVEGLNRFVCRHAGIHRICADLDLFDIPRGRYSLIVNIRYLNRRLFPALREGLCRGGLLIFESYRTEPAGTTSGPHRSEHLLRPDELRKAFSPLRIIAYQEHPSRQEDTPSMKASMVAIRPDGLPRERF